MLGTENMTCGLFLGGGVKGEKDSKGYIGKEGRKRKKGRKKEK